MLPWGDIINIIGVVAAVLALLLERPETPPEWVPFLIFGIAVLNALISLLKTLFPQTALGKLATALRR